MNKKIISGIILIIMMILITNSVQAAGYQANKGGKSKVNTIISAFFKGIRDMEASGGTLGLSATISTSNFSDVTPTSATTKKNGIDCHMAKNTEWGTAAMLSASIYGSAPSGISSASTTGNESGIYQMADGKYEYVAGIYYEPTTTNSSYRTNIVAAADYYKNIYTSETKYSIAGDGILETDNWLDTSLCGFFSSSNPVFRRGIKALFGYNSFTGASNSFHTSRAVVVCGVGL